MATRKPRVQIEAHLTTPAPRVVPLASAVELPIAYVVPDPKQPRKDWEHESGARRLEELARSIGQFGILQPLLVRTWDPLPDGTPQYMIVAGARRRAAAERAGLATVPVVIRDHEHAQVRVLQLIENLQRQDLSPLDEARAYQELMDIEQLSPPGVAERLHISPQHVRDRLRVLADQVLADAVESRRLSVSAAREIMKMPDDEMMAFRGRVASGERLQINDVVAARARLVAAGVMNPRRTPGGRGGRQTMFAPPPAEPPGHGAPGEAQGGSDGTAGQTLFAPSAATMPGSLAERPQEGTGIPARPGSAGGASLAADLDPGSRIPESLMHTGDRLAGLLDASLRGQRREQVATALDEISGSPYARACWQLVLERLRLRLGGSGQG